MSCTNDGLNTEAGKTCTHYWMIEPHIAPTSLGVCRFCGSEREFKNYLENLPPAVLFDSKEYVEHQYKFLVDA